MKKLTKPIRAIHFMVLAFLMTIGSQASAQISKKIRPRHKIFCQFINGYSAIVSKSFVFVGR
jgi:hypothetical protein